MDEREPACSADFISPNQALLRSLVWFAFYCVRYRAAKGVCVSGIGGILAEIRGSDDPLYAVETFPSSARATTYLSNQQGEIVKSDKSPSQIRNFEIADWTRSSEVQSEISDFGFEMQDSSDFKIPSHRCLVSQVC